MRSAYCLLLATTTNPGSPVSSRWPSTSTRSRAGRDRTALRTIGRTYERCEMPPRRCAARSCTTSASKPTEAISVKHSPPATPRSQARTTPASHARRSGPAPLAIPHWRANRFSVPSGHCQSGSPRSAQARATSRTAPSPPVTTARSTASAIASSSQERSSPGCVSTSRQRWPPASSSPARREAAARARPAPAMGLNRTSARTGLVKNAVVRVLPGRVGLVIGSRGSKGRLGRFPRGSAV